MIRGMTGTNDSAEGHPCPLSLNITTAKQRTDKTERYEEKEEMLDALFLSGL